MSTHTYRGGGVTTWAVKKSDCTISRLLARLTWLDGYHPGSYWFYKDMNSNGKGFLAPLLKTEDAEALAYLGDRQGGIRVFVQHGISHLNGWD